MPVLPHQNGQPDPSPIYTDGKKTAFKDMLRQRQTALRNNRAIAGGSDTQSRRSAASGSYVNRTYYPSQSDGQQQHQQQYLQQQQQQQQQQYEDHGHGISLQSLREEASVQGQWQQQQQQQRQDGPNIRAQPININTNNGGLQSDLQGGIIIHGPPEPPITTRRQQGGSEPEIYTKHWNQGQPLNVDSTAPTNNNNGDKGPVSQDAYDLREMLLLQRSNGSQKRQSQDSNNGLSKHSAKDNEKPAITAMSACQRTSPQQDNTASSVQDFSQDSSDTVIFLPRVPRTEDPSTQSTPSVNPTPVPPESKPQKTAKQPSKQPSKQPGKPPALSALATGGSPTSSHAPLPSPKTRTKNNNNNNNINNPASPSTSIKLSVINVPAASKSSIAGMSSEGLPLSTKFTKKTTSQPSSPIITKTLVAVGNDTNAPISAASKPPTSTQSVSATKQSTPASPATPATPAKSASQAESTAGSSKPDVNTPEGIKTREEQLRQQVQATLRKKTAGQSASGGANDSNDGKTDAKPAPIILSTTRKAHPDSGNQEQEQPAKRPKIGSGGKDAVVGLSLEAIRGARAALDASAASSPATPSSATAVTGGSGLSHDSKPMAPRSRTQSFDPRLGQVKDGDDNGKESPKQSDQSKGQDRADVRMPNRDRDPMRETERNYVRGPPIRTFDREMVPGPNFERDMGRGWYDPGYDRVWDDRGYNRRADWGYERGFDRGYERPGDYVYGRYDDTRPYRDTDWIKDRRMDGPIDRLMDRPIDRATTDRTGDRNKETTDRPSDRTKARDNESERRAEQGRERSNDKAPEWIPGKDINQSSAKKDGVQGEGAPEFDSTNEADAVITKVKVEPTISWLLQAPEEPPILFAAASRLQADLISSPSSSQHQQQQLTRATTDTTPPLDDDAPILFSAASRIQQQQQQQQQQQNQHLQQQQQHHQHQEASALHKDTTMKPSDGDSPILFSSAHRLQQQQQQQQELEAPILFSAASRLNNAISSSVPTFSSSVTQDTSKPQILGGSSSYLFGSSTMSQGVTSTSISATAGLNPKDLSFMSSYNLSYNAANSSLNVVMTPQGEVGKSDMSLAFEVMDRCTVDLLLLQKRYATVTAQLNEVTSKALESDARLAQLGAQIELELKMSRVHHQMKNGFEQQQLPELQRMIRATQEMISRLSHLSTSAAAGSATSVVVRPQLRMVPTVAGGALGAGAGVGAGVGSGTGSGSGSSSGTAHPSAVAFALDRLAQSATASTAGTATATVSMGDSHSDLRFTGAANQGQSSDMDIDSMGPLSSSASSAAWRQQQQQDMADKGSSSGSSAARNPGTAPSSSSSAVVAVAGTTGGASEEAVVVIRPCLSFNIAPKGCRFRASNHPCPYLHTCLYCGSSNHAVLHCDYTSVEPSQDNVFR
ncbi:hypothetical protein BGX33_005992 [Mortierella sp. NVP41]|nr:hypothetical protein BGX33_005992 [Mortierella sp. NVP41]